MECYDLLFCNEQSGKQRACLLFSRLPNRRRSRISAANETSPAVNFLKKQQSSERVARLSEHPPLGRQAEKDLANGLEMDRPALTLLGAGVDVAQPALERVFIKDRSRAGRTIDGSDDVARLMDRPSRRQAQPDVLFVQELAPTLGLFPHFGEGLVDESA